MFVSKEEDKRKRGCRGWLIFVKIQSVKIDYLKFWVKYDGGRHSSVVSSAPTILRPRVRIPSTPSMLFSICIEIVTRKE